jgi:hypothetical protein
MFAAVATGVRLDPASSKMQFALPRVFNIY